MRTDIQKESSPSFIATLPNIFSAVEIQQCFRIVSQGVFIHEEIETPVLEAYQNWLKKVTGSSGEKSEAKCRRRLFQNESPKLFYLLDGKLCIPGYLIPCDNIQSLKIKIPISQASLMDTTSYLHARDPMLDNLKNIKAEIDPRKGLLLKIKTRNTEYNASVEVLKNFALAAKGSDTLTKELPGLAGPLRACLEPLQVCLNRARYIESATRLLVPKNYAKDPFNNFLKYKHLVFVTNNKQTEILYCYPIAERSLAKFVREELKLYKNLIYSQQVIGKKVNPRILGSIKVKRKEYLVYTRALLRFISSLAKVSTTKKHLPNLYTVEHCVKELIKTLGEAQKEPPLKNKINRQKQTPSIVFRNGPWHFSMTKNSHLIDCHVQYKKRRHNQRQQKTAK